MSNDDRIQLEVDELRQDVDKLQETVFSSKGLEAMVYEHEGALIMIATELEAVRHAILLLASLLLVILVVSSLGYFILFREIITTLG